MNLNTKVTILGSAILMSLLALSSAHAELVKKKFEYKQGDTALEGYIASDSKYQGKRPAILIFPQYTGPSDFERDVADKLATLGYVAMVADVYGVGIRPPAPKEAGAEMGKYLKDRPLLRARTKAALDRLASESNVNPEKIGTIGYCFGGAGVLELGRQGANVKALVSLHGTLNSPTLDDGKNIKGKVLVLHGADDPAVPVTDVNNFIEEMKKGSVDLTFTSYSDTKHSFTLPSAGSDKTRSSFYNPISARRAWASMIDFLDETLSN